MRIESNFKDYYDHISGRFGGGDPLLRYRRTRLKGASGAGSDAGNDVEVFVTRWERLHLPYRLAGRPTAVLSFEMDGFRWLSVCGRPYPLIDTGGGRWQIFDPVQHRHLVNPLDEVMREMAKPTVRGAEDPAFTALSQALGAPVFVVKQNDWSPQWHRAGWGGPWRITVDAKVPVLASVGLPALYPAEQLYQDIAYFIGNRINRSADTIAPPASTDLDKVLQHGFDPRQSFRHRR